MTVSQAMVVLTVSQAMVLTVSHHGRLTVSYHGMVVFTVSQGMY